MSDLYLCRGVSSPSRRSLMRSTETLRFDPESGLIFNPPQTFLPNEHPPDPKVATYWCPDCAEFSDDLTPARKGWDGDSCPICGGIRCEYVGETWGPR